MSNENKSNNDNNQNETIDDTVLWNFIINQKWEDVKAFFENNEYSDGFKNTNIHKKRIAGSHDCSFDG